MKSVHSGERQIKWKKVTTLLIVLVLLACVLPGQQYAGAEAAVGTTKDKIRHEAHFLFSGNMDKITVRTVKTSFDTGERKVNELQIPPICLNQLMEMISTPLLMKLP
ncbi:hypothetical protein D3C73_770130 [compost metagenome]